MNRYEFEFLSYIAEHNGEEYNQRVISDEICISGTQVKNSYEKALSEGYIIERNPAKTIVEITPLGLDALEPYRVKRAVILAAGFGSRMMPATVDRPKPLVSVNGRKIIETLIDSLLDAGIEDITIIRGYHKEKFDDLLERYPGLRLIDNDIYDSTNNISSAIAALDYFKEGCYLCEADLYITNPKVIKKYQYASNILGSFSLETDDWSYRLKDGYITDYKKGNTYCYNYYGISYWTPEDCVKLCEDWTESFKTEEGRDVFWEQIPLQLKADRYNVEVRICNKSDIMEIDNYYELQMVDSSYK
jgi:CTP:phosphocholine cytidylyltransferase-like protein